MVRPFSSGWLVSIGFHAEEVRLIYALGDFGRFSVEMEVMSMFAGVHRLRNKVAVFSVNFDNRTIHHLFWSM